MSSPDLDHIYQKIKNLTNAANKPLTDLEPVESKIKLLPDESISPSKFKQSNISTNIYYANSLTIAAVKKELFQIGEGFEDLQDNRQCIDCSRVIDAQFWKFCPFCEGQISKDPIK